MTGKRKLPSGWLPDDLHGLTTSDLKRLDADFVDIPECELHKWIREANARALGKRMAVSQSNTNVQEPPLKAVVVSRVHRSSTIGPPSQQTLAKAFQTIMRIRSTKAMPDGRVVADAIRYLADAPEDAIQKQWPAGCPNLPAARATWLANLALDKSVMYVRELVMHDAIYTQFCSWRKSADAYASAISVWSMSQKALAYPSDDPTEEGVATFCKCFRNGKSLEQYIARLCSIFKWLQLPLKFLAREFSKPLVDGAIKRTDESCRRVKQAASASQSRQMIKYLRGHGLKAEADSFAICRHFALRFKSEALKLDWDGANCRIALSGSTCTISCVRRTSKSNEKLPIVRSCICELQDPLLCGVCILKNRKCKVGPLFPSLTYADALWRLKDTAAALNWPDPETWGLHCWRRGYGRDAFQSVPD